MLDDLLHFFLSCTVLFTSLCWFFHILCCFTWPTLWPLFTSLASTLFWFDLFCPSVSHAYTISVGSLLFNYLLPLYLCYVLFIILSIFILLIFFKISFLWLFKHFSLFFTMLCYRCMYYFRHHFIKYLHSLLCRNFSLIEKLNDTVNFSLSPYSLPVHYSFPVAENLHSFFYSVSLLTPKTWIFYLSLLSIYICNNISPISYTMCCTCFSNAMFSIFFQWILLFCLC